MVLKTFFPSCGVRASLLFFSETVKVLEVKGVEGVGLQHHGVTLI